MVLQWLNITETTSVAMTQGALVGVIFLFALLLIWRLAKYKWVAAGVLLALITPLATLGFWHSHGQLGISDWDYYFSLHTGHRQTLLTYHQLPQWNPWICGGTAALADPEFRFFTPTFLLQLVFGIPAGFRLAIWLATATGAIGMLMLGKRLKLSVYAALLAGTAFAFGSVNLLEIVEGHPNIFAAMFIPWVLWSWLAAYRNATNRKWWIIATGALLTLTFFQGGIYLLMYTAIAFAGLIVVSPRRREALLTTIYSGLWALGFAAVKLIPVFLWLSQFQDQVYASSPLTLPFLHKILLGRYLHGVEGVFPGQEAGWHEYGAYIGPIVLILALIGLIRNYNKRIVVMLGVAALLAILISSTGPLLKPLFDQAPFLPRSNISRFILFAVIPISLLAGYGVDVIQSRKQWRTVLAIVVIGLAAVDLMSLSYALSKQAFVLPHTVPAIPAAPSPIGYTTLDYKTRHNGVDYTRAYDARLQGYGTMAYCSVLSPEPAVRTVHDEVDTEIITVRGKSGQDGTFQLIEWTPNRVTVDITAQEDSEVILNTNYAKGWFVNEEAAIERAGRVTTDVSAGEHRLVFRYKTPGLGTGVTISLLSLVGAVAYRSLYPRSPSRK
ncbi:MAG: hypothetical protein WD200_03910 [Candidatus Andersenbacteria bacterium]